MTIPFLNKSIYNIKLIEFAKLKNSQMLNSSDFEMIDTSSKPLKPSLLPSRESDAATALEIDQDDAWTVIRAYFQQHGLVSQQISSFNRFMNFGVQDIVQENGEIQIEVTPQYQLGKFKNI